MNESSISVPISTKQFVELVRFLDEKGSDRDPVEVIQDASEYWVENADWVHLEGSFSTTWHSDQNEIQRPVLQCKRD